MSVIPIDHVEKVLRKRGTAERVIERIVKLNPNGVTEGSYARGWHPSERYRSQIFHMGLVGKRKFIAKHGRKAWEALPNGLKHHYGRRQYVTWETFLDNLHVIYMGAEPPPHIKAWAHFPTKAFANDPDCIIEIRRRA